MAARTQDDSAGGRDGVAVEIFAKHSRSQQPESIQICAALTAILDVVESQLLKPSATVLYAATMASLERSHSDQSHQVRL